jgi:hypothetical protein
MARSIGQSRDAASPMRVANSPKSTAEGTRWGTPKIHYQRSMLCGHFKSMPSLRLPGADGTYVHEIRNYALRRLGDLARSEFVRHDRRSGTARNHPAQRRNDPSRCCWSKTTPTRPKH